MKLSALLQYISNLYNMCPLIYEKKTIFLISSPWSPTRSVLLSRHFVSFMLRKKLNSRQEIVLLHFRSFIPGNILNKSIADIISVLCWLSVFCGPFIVVIVSWYLNLVNNYKSTANITHPSFVFYLFVFSFHLFILFYLITSNILNT